VLLVPLGAALLFAGVALVAWSAVTNPRDE
jgi:hypothetical protein